MTVMIELTWLKDGSWLNRVVTIVIIVTIILIIDSTPPMAVETDRYTSPSAQSHRGHQLLHTVDGASLHASQTPAALVGQTAGGRVL